MNLDLSIAVYDASHAEALPSLELLATQLSEQGIKVEFLWIATYSPQGTRDRIGECPVRFEICADATCGAFMRTAQEACQGRWLITLDHPTASDSSVVLAFWHRRNEADLLIASRYCAHGSCNMPWLRSLLSRNLNRLYRAGLSVPIHDVSSDRRMYRTSILKKVKIEGGDYDVLMEVLLKYMSHGGDVMELPWHYVSSESRHAKGTLWRLLSSSLKTFWKLHGLRNSVDFPDYDARAYDSRIWLQRYWQRTRFKTIRRMAPLGGKTLDAGCGGSRMIMLRPEVYAMDLSFTRLRSLRHSNLRRFQATAGTLPFAAETFDTVVSSQVIEHTTESTCISECVRVLKVGGTLVLGTPDYASWWPYIEFVYGIVKGGGYADEHVTRYTKKSLTEELTTLHCDIHEYFYIGRGELIIHATKRK